MRAFQSIGVSVLLALSVVSAVVATDATAPATGDQGVGDALRKQLADKLKQKGDKAIVDARITKQLEYTDDVTKRLQNTKKLLTDHYARLAALWTDEDGKRLARDPKATLAFWQYWCNPVCSTADVDHELGLLQPVQKYLSDKRAADLRATDLDEVFKTAGIEAINTWVNQKEAECDGRSRSLEAAVKAAPAAPAAGHADVTLGVAVWPLLTGGIHAAVSMPSGLETLAPSASDTANKKADESLGSAHDVYLQYIKSGDAEDFKKLQAGLDTARDEARKDARNMQELLDELKDWPAGAVAFFRDPKFAQPFAGGHAKQMNDRRPVSFKALEAQHLLELEKDNGPLRMSEFMRDKNNDRAMPSMPKITNRVATGEEKQPYLKVIRTIKKYHATMVDLGILSD